MTLLDSNAEIVFELAKEDSAQAIVEFMGKFPEISFCEWQDTTFLKNIISKDSTVIIIAKHNSEIIGAIISGIMGTRATVNHIAILENYRKMYIGSDLVRINYDEIKKRGVKRIFLFVENDNSVARSFWHKEGFRVRVDETTMERDI